MLCLASAPTLLMELGDSWQSCHCLPLPAPLKMEHSDIPLGNQAFLLSLTRWVYIWKLLVTIKGLRFPSHQAWGERSLRSSREMKSREPSENPGCNVSVLVCLPDALVCFAACHFTGLWRLTDPPLQPLGKNNNWVGLLSPYSKPGVPYCASLAPGHWLMATESGGIRSWKWARLFLCENRMNSKCRMEIGVLCTIHGHRGKKWHRRTWMVTNWDKWFMISGRSVCVDQDEKSERGEKLEI